MKKFAVVGDGEAAKLHIKSIASVGKLAAVCGEEGIETIAPEYNAKAYRSFDEMLAIEKDTDVVVVCSPVGHHAEHIIKSLQAGRDVLCESPLCLTKAAAWQIIETEKYCGQRVYLIQAPRFYFLLDLQEFGEHIQGNIYSFDLKLTADLPLSFFSGFLGQRFPGGGLLYTAFAPFMDLLVSLFGEIEIAEGFAPPALNNLSNDVENYGAVVLKMQSGVIGTLHWLDIPHGHINTLTTFTDNGQIGNAFNDLDLLQLYENKPLSDETCEILSSSFYKIVYDDLLKALQGENVNFPTTLDGAKTVEAIEKIYKALR